MIIPGYSEIESHARGQRCRSVCFFSLDARWCALCGRRKQRMRVSTVRHIVDIQRWNNWQVTKSKRNDTGWEAIGSDLSSERMTIGKREGWTIRALKANEIGILLTIDTAIVLGAEPLPLYIFKYSI